MEGFFKLGPHLPLHNVPLGSQAVKKHPGHDIHEKPGVVPLVSNNTTRR